LQGTTFSGAQLDGADFTKVQLLKGADTCPQMEGRSLSWHPRRQETGATFRGAQVQGAGVIFRGAGLPGAFFSTARLPGADFRDAQLQGALFNQEAELQGADFSGAQLQGASFTGAQLQGASFRGAQLQGASFRGAQLQGASFKGAQLETADFGDEDLQPQAKALLGGEAQLQGADFRRANLWGVRHLPTDLADFEGVDFTPTPEAERKRLAAHWLALIPPDYVLHDVDIQLSTFAKSSEDQYSRFRAKFPLASPAPERLADVLKAIACAPHGAPHVARGVIRNGAVERTGEHAAALAQWLLKDEVWCPGTKGLDPDSLAQLRRIAGPNGPRR
jgi:uncharacterized protein YjbI with pentapeptide repeats